MSGQGIYIRLDGASYQSKQVYLQLCHISGLKISAGTVARGQDLGTVANDNWNSHIHLALVADSSSPSSSQRISVPFTGDFSFDAGKYDFAPSSSTGAYECALGYSSGCGLISSAPASASPATMTSPAPGSTFSGASVTFTRNNGSGANAWFLGVGYAPGAGEILWDWFPNASLTVTVPADGRQVYARLFSLINGAWQANDYTYRAATAVSYTKASMTSPSNGSTLGGSSASFSFSAGSGATGYFLYMGRSQGANDIFASAVSCCSQNVGGLPTDGSTVWARLWTNLPTGWQFSDYSYRAATASTRTEVIVDDTSSGFVRGGNASYWYQASIGYNSHMWWTYVRQSGVDDWAKWTPRLTGAGNYEVFVFIPRDNATSTNAGYRVHHNGGDDGRRINQSPYYDQWVSIGTYYFNAASDEYVFMGDETYETSGSRKIGFDAVKFVPR